MKGKVIMRQTTNRVARLCLIGAATGVLYAAGAIPVSVRASKSAALTLSGHHKQPAGNTVDIIWREPLDLEKRDLFNGIGGKKGWPDPSDRFRFLKKLTGGHSEKIEAIDPRDRKWKIKLGGEARPETAATRIVWAVGYHTDQDYFVDEANIDGHGIVRNARFERDDDGYQKVDRWDWNRNPFVGTRELEGLKVLMALLGNWDLKTENNKIVSPKKTKAGEPAPLIYYVNDLGATLGSTGKWFGKLPLFGELPAGSKGSARDFASEDFIGSIQHGIITFNMKRTRAQRAIVGVKVENARWIGNLLARLSHKQLSDAFRAAHYSEHEIDLYVNSLSERINRLQGLK